MYFIGSGTLLSSAIGYSLDAGLKADGACCPAGDHSIPRLRKLGVRLLETGDPNSEPALADSASDGIVFSINNAHIIGDELLAAGAKFFNVHNGLIHQYRGRAEVCIFAALCSGERRYGVTLHQLLPGRKVDSGPVVAQMEFELAPDDTFATVLEKSIGACRRIFEANVRDIASGSYRTFAVETAGSAFTHKDLARLCAEAPAARLARAADFGDYAGFFPALVSAIARERDRR
jgi:methionyl-tRNA formyltransferase